MAESILKKKQNYIESLAMPGTLMAPHPMLLMKSTGLVMFGAVGNLKFSIIKQFFPQNDPPEEEVQLERVDLVFHQQDLERHLGGEDQLVALKQTPERWKGFF